MTVTKITNLEFGKMVQAAAAKLNAQAEFINSLNVFPVPDGDTGTNMSMSMASGAKYERDATSTSVGDLAQALAKGLLMGARGNSGVILSQIFRGFAKGCTDKQELSAKDFVDAYANGAQTAYKAVMKPTEGTILTVVRESAQAGLNEVKAGNEDLVDIMEKIYDASETALQKTPDLLPVLKEVGVVDSGGQGLVFVLQAFYESLSGKVVENDLAKPDNAQIDEMINAKHHQSAQGKLNPDDIKYGYCTQMMVRIGRGKQVTQKFDYDTFYNYLAKLGDSLLVINDDEVVKVHVHTEFPGKVLSWGQQFGDLQTVKVDNMRWQQEEIMEKDEGEPTPLEKAKEAEKPALDTAVIAVASGDGIAKLLESLGVTHVINGGQTMNPSIQEIAEAINESGAKQALVLPDNGNIFMAADQAAEVADIPTKVVHAKTIAQGMSAMLEFNPEADLEENQANMEGNLDTVKSGEVTNAVRDTTIDGQTIKKDDFMGIVDGKIVNTAADVKTAAIEMIKQMLDEDSEIVTIFYGVDGDKETAEAIKEAILDVDDELDVQIYDGGQPVYPYLISVE
ncbi:DAK2 domain-containing protein [Limosilactobacillus mucosae]|uniref:DAK2 domain-containing protein n=1 Tax=Limosilactobacillus mucosae TaxID=97478 RepID=A0AAJ1MAW3_LIMMU|nr:DAK2 domain-containing protein [Limosilactobacillus mucosae]MDC2830200.1 DAK2 domain-containing protein [Limosilactobacillus mucosae]MDC2837771.1 DAK2 domain-containing protein [Limosilactobacillus mucosae]MDC2849788.1 DAK2 domain-containing protein [Limosilactobacillus mucosae]MDC2853924.1 DAK2 domain-containing protein [Limosilactobacillus mucosae]